VSTYSARRGSKYSYIFKTNKYIYSPTLKMSLPIVNCSPCYPTEASLIEIVNMKIKDVQKTSTRARK
jgi:hypothetical protein